MDLHFVLELGRSSDSREPYLVEIGARLKSGIPEKRIFVWSSGTIGASIGGDEVRISRELGLIGHGHIVLTVSQLRALHSACKDWRRLRDEWAAFWSSSAGYVFGGAWYYQAAGIESTRVCVGEETIGRPRDEPFSGKDVFHKRELSLLAPRPAVIAEIWREGEKYGDPAGEKVGLVYSLGSRVRFEAQRHGGKLVSHRKWIGIEPSDVKFLSELLAVVPEA